MKHPNYDRAFRDTPDYIRSAIELGIRKGEQKMKLRRRRMRALAVAAACLVVLGAAAFGASRLAAPRPDNRVASQPRASATDGESAPTAIRATPEVTELTTPTPGVDLTPEPTPEPTIEAEAEIANPDEVEAEEAGEVEVSEASKIEVTEADFAYAYLGLTPEDIVYCAPGDDRFHFNANCPELDGRVTAVAHLGAAMQDHRICEACKPMEAAVIFTEAKGVMLSAATGDILVYYNPKGNYFHVNSDCSGMMGAELHTLSEAIAARKFHCPVCIGDKATLYWLDVPQEDGDSVYTSPYSGYYHRDGDCFHLPAIIVDTYGSVVRDGRLAPCPRCLPTLAGAFDSPLCYVARGNNFYHASPNCGQISGETSAATSELEAQAEGRLRCPDCADEGAALPERGEAFVELFGGWLNDAYPGWNFERADPRGDGGADWYVSTGANARPNPRRACCVTATAGGAVAFELGGDSMDGARISHDFLNALPEAILAACERDAMEAIRSAMATPDEARASEIFDNVARIRIEAEPNGEIANFELEFRDPSGSAIPLRWQKTSGEYELSNPKTHSEG